MEGRIVTNQTAEDLQGVFFDADSRKFMTNKRHNTELDAYADAVKQGIS